MDWLEPLRQDTEKLREQNRKLREGTEKLRELNQTSKRISEIVKNSKLYPFMTTPAEDFNYEDLLKEDKVIFTFPVLWHEWECDGTAWVMEKEDGTRYLKMTNHGGEYISDTSELTSRICSYESAIADTKKALELLS